MILRGDGSEATDFRYIWRDEETWRATMWSWSPKGPDVSNDSRSIQFDPGGEDNPKQDFFQVCDF